MILVKGRELLIPENERYIGTTYDDNSTVRTFRIPRFHEDGMDKSQLDFYVIINYDDGSDPDAVGVVKAVNDDYIVLEWDVGEDITEHSGCLFLWVRGFDYTGAVRWSSFPGVFYIETSGTEPSDLSDLEERISEEDKLIRLAKLYKSQPMTAATAAEMVNRDRVYVYVGDEAGYTYGRWYFWDGDAWVPGGVYNSIAIQTDKELIAPDVAADAKAVGDELTDLKNAVDAKKIWSIQTNVGEQTFYGLFASVDGLGHKMVEGYSGFLDNAPADIGTEWYPFRHGDYYGFAITYSQTNYDMYVAITKDFVHWVHAPQLIGFRSASSYSGAYVWTPQIFEYKNKTYVAATVQEGAVIGNGSRYDTAARQSAIYVTEINIDYETAAVTRVNPSAAFTRVPFSTVTDKAEETHNITGYSMDAWFVPTDDKLYCVFNDRYMLQIHAAVADDITDTFTICKQNIFQTTDIEAPTVFQIDDNLWKVCGCVWNTPYFGEELNLCCYTSDFVNFRDFQVMRRLDQTMSDGTLYTRRMRNPAFFYMDAALEHEFCRTHVVKTLGYDHIFKTHQSDLNYAVYNMLTYTDIALPPNTELLVKSTGISFPELALGDIYGGDSQLRIINKEGALRTITYAGTAYDLADGEGLMIDFRGKTVSRFGSVATKTGTDVITKNSEIAALDVSNVNANKLNGMINLSLEVGNCPIKNGITILGTLSSEYRPSTMQLLAGYIGHAGADSAADIPVRVVIYRNGVVHVIGTVDSATVDTLRCSATYISR